MAPTATLNVRMPEDLKRNGDMVLARAGVSVSDAVRELYRLLEREQTVPAWLTEGRAEDAFEHRRQLLRSVAGAAAVPSDFDLDDLKRERLAGLIEDAGDGEAADKADGETRDEAGDEAAL